MKTNMEYYEAIRAEGRIDIQFETAEQVTAFLNGYTMVEKNSKVKSYMLGLLRMRKDDDFSEDDLWLNIVAIGEDGHGIPSLSSIHAISHQDLLDIFDMDII